MGELYLFADNIFTGTRRILAERSGPYFDRRFFVFHRKSFRKRILLSKVAAVLVIPLKTESNEIPLTSLVMMLNITKLIDFEKC